MNSALRLFELVRSQCGWDFEMLHDVHERIPAIDGVWFAKEVEQYRLFFLEDLFSPEDQDYFRLVRQPMCNAVWRWANCGTTRTR